MEGNFPSATWWLVSGVVADGKLQGSCRHLKTGTPAVGRAICLPEARIDLS